MRIAVAGGTGVVGRLVVARLAELGHERVVLSRTTGVDVRSGSGLAAALEGVDAVVDVLSTGAAGRRAATGFFVDTTTRLLRAGSAAGVRHHLALSIVGVDAAAHGYHRGKLAQETAVAAGAVPWSLLRATQLHEFAGQMLQRLSLGPVGAVPRMRVQPVAATTVAAHLADLATGPPRGRVPDLAGPAEEDLVAMARAVAPRLGVRRVVPLRVPGAAGRQMRDGSLLAGPGATTAGPAFAQWLG